MKVNRKYISPLTTDDLIRKIDAKRPGFAARVDARVSELALARRVKFLREKRGMTQAELAAKVGTGQAAIARIESGKATPKLDLLSRIAGALDARLNVTLSPLRA